MAALLNEIQSHHCDSEDIVTTIFIDLLLWVPSLEYPSLVFPPFQHHLLPFLRASQTLSSQEDCLSHPTSLRLMSTDQLHHDLCTWLYFI